MRRLVAALALVAGLGNALAQPAFPDRPIRIVVHVTAGSGSDAATRFVGERLSRVLGQSVIVENRPGAGGVVAVNALRAAPADGHTMLMTSISTLSVNPVVVKDLPYDPVRDLRPISGLIRTTSAIVVGADSTHRSFRDLVAAGRAQGGAGLQFAHYAPGYRLAVEWLADLTGMRVVEVPYKGPSAMLPDVIEGRVDFAIIDLGGVDALVKSGRLRVLAVSSERRQPLYPEVPTVAELGYRDWVNHPWTALHVRADTPDEVAATLSNAMRKVLAMPEVQDYARRTAGTDLLPLSPAEIARFNVEEIQRFRRIADKVGIRPE